MRSVFRHSSIPPFALALFALLALAELLAIRIRGRGRWDWGESAASFAIALGHRAAGAAAAFLWAGVYQAAWRHRVATVPLDTAWGVALLFVGVEFLYYWQHRASHRIRWLWASHAVHHSVESLNFSAAYRLGWTAGPSGAGLFFLPLIMAGFAPVSVAAAIAANLAYQFLLHTEQVGRLGPLESILNTPSHHRVHHASNPAYLDCNYGGVTIVFDRLFGTFAAERAEEQCRYGLVVPVASRNPLVIVFHEWGRMLRDLRGARSWRAVVGVTFGPPGWRDR